jgi:hypothetical protein
VAAGSPGTQTAIGSLNELGILENNGGPTETIALIPSSTMIAGAVGCMDWNSVPIAFDQRDHLRPPSITNHCDIGAFEYNELFANGFELPPAP